MRFFLTSILSSSTQTELKEYIERDKNRKEELLKKLENIHNTIVETLLELGKERETNIKIVLTASS